MKNKWKLLIIIMFLVLIPVGITCKERYDVNEDVIIIDTIVRWGEGAECNITTYNKSLNLVDSSIMDRSGISYSVNLSTLPRNTYTSNIECNISSNVYIGECKFKVGEEVSMWELMISIIMGLITAIFFYLMVQTKSFDLKIIWGTLGALFIVFDLWFVYRVVNLLSGDAGITSNVLRIYEISLIAYKWYFALIVIYFMIRVIVTLVKWRKGKTDEKNIQPFDFR